jgi:Ca2+-binding RTX toxin-like protein
MRARFLNSDLGRFSSIDPLGIASGDSNLYRYAFNDPLLFLDPNGEKSFKVRSVVYDSRTPNIFLGAPFLQQEPLADEEATPDFERSSLFRLISGTVEFIPIKYKKPTRLEPKPGKFKIPIKPARLTANYARTAPPVPYDPLILDLDGDGIELISVEQSGVVFDLNADGFREQTGWVSPDDGMLALDANDNAQIDNITELFGDATTDGFDELRNLDSNSDNVINSNDIQFGQLRIWQDLDQDGVTGAGELKTLDQLDIESISLNTTETFYEIEGSLIRSTSQFSFTGGTQNEAASIWFSVDQINTTYDQPFQLKPETLFLPTVRAYGQLPDLYIAMSLDNQLLSLMRDFVQLDIAKLDQAYSKIEAILFRWAGVEELEPDSRGEFFDARKLGFMEKFLLQNLDFNFTSDFNTLFVRQAWETISRAITGRLIAQGAMRSLFPGTVYDLNQDILETSVDLATLLASIQANAPSEVNEATRYWSYVIAALDAHEDLFGLSASDYNAQVTSALEYSGLSDYLEAIRNAIWGTDGNDQLLGNEFIGGRDSIASFVDGLSGNDTLSGTSKNDILQGGDGDDIIELSMNFGLRGIDLVDGGPGFDTLVDADFSNETGDLIIDQSVNQKVSLSDGTQINGIEHYIKLFTGIGNDIIEFTSRLNNTINAGAGDDVINPGLGESDLVDGGIGNDTLIIDYSQEETGHEAAFLISGTSSNGASGITYRFSEDGIFILDKLSFYQIENFKFTGTSYDDIIETWDGNDVIVAGGGNDEVRGSKGNDFLDGGSGIDKISLDFSVQNSSFNLTNLIAGINILDLVAASNFEEFDITTGSGDDTITQLSVFDGSVVRYADTFRTGAGDDVINAGLGKGDTVSGGDGDDLLILDYSQGDTGQSLRFFGDGISGNDEASGFAFRSTADGSDNLDSISFDGINRYDITGTSQDDFIRTWNGNDIIRAGAGNDEVRGNLGVDTLDGGIGIDRVTLDFSNRANDLGLINLIAGINISDLVAASNFEEFDIADPARARYN